MEWGIEELQGGGVMMWWSCGVGELQCGEVAEWGDCGVGELQCGEIGRASCRERV